MAGKYCEHSHLLYSEMDSTQKCPVHRNSTTPDHTVGNVIPLNELKETYVNEDCIMH